jgi:hypothetical protein
VVVGRCKFVKTTTSFWFFEVFLSFMVDVLLWVAILCCGMFSFLFAVEYVVEKGFFNMKIV